MEFIHDELKNIDDQLFDKEKQEKKKHLLKLCNEAKNFHIIDSANLKSVFDFFRNPKIEFDK